MALILPIEYRLLCHQARGCADCSARKRLSILLYMADRYEPPHIHVVKEQNAAKFWLDPLELEFNDGFRNHELVEIRRIIEAYMDDLRSAWYKTFGDRNPKV